MPLIVSISLDIEFIWYRSNYLYSRQVDFDCCEIELRYVVIIIIIVTVQDLDHCCSPCLFVMSHVSRANLNGRRLFKQVCRRAYVLLDTFEVREPKELAEIFVNSPSVSQVWDPIIKDINTSQEEESITVYGQFLAINNVVA